MYDVEVQGQGPEQVVTLHDLASKSKVKVAPNLGFSCFSFVATLNDAEHDLLYAGPEWPDPSARATHHGIPLLAPFPNRIRNGRYAYDGHEYTLPLNEHGRNAIHGFVMDRPWNHTKGISDEGAWIRGEFQLSRDAEALVSLWPADFKLAVTYRLTGTKLHCLIEVENPDSKPLPFGFGTHPYFRFPQTAACQWRVPVSQHVELEKCLPIGKAKGLNGAEAELPTGVSLNTRTFDDVYTGLVAKNGRVEAELIDNDRKIGIRQSHDPAFRYAVLFTPVHGQAVCVEPYTCVTDAINMYGWSDYDPGLWRLDPGQKRTLWIELEAFSF